MQSEESVVNVAKLRRQWSRWTAIVATFAKRRDARPRLRRGEYFALHNTLIEACRSHATQCDAAQRDFFLEMRNVVKPWISLQTLEQAEHRVLVSLTRRCRDIERSLGGRGRALAGLRPLALIAALMLVVIAVICFEDIIGSGQWSAAAVLQSGRNGMSRLAYLLRDTTWPQRFAVVTVIVVLVGIQSVRSAARKY